MDRPSQPNGDMTELERRMLEAARHDRVPDPLVTRMAEGLGVQVAPAALQSTLGAGSQLGAPLFAKAGLWGVLSLALVAGVVGWRAAQPAAPAQRAVEAPRASAPSEAQSATAVAPAASSAVAAVDPAGEGARPSEQGASALDGPAAGSDDDALRAEVALLDGARNALRKGASARALHLLDQHGERFARARLAPEAAALRIEALVQRGSHEQAGSMSRAFANDYPGHPLGAHVAKLTATAHGAER